ncbi:MAG: hypothetical protein Q9160_004347 [Pyrenula sp. 1 TL-2023]
MTESTDSLSSQFLALRRQIDGLEENASARVRHMRSEAEHNLKACKEVLEHEIAALRRQLRDKEVSAQSDFAKLRAQLPGADNDAPKGLPCNNALKQQLTYQTSLSDAYLAQLSAVKDELRKLRTRVAYDAAIHHQLTQKLEKDKVLRSLVIDVKYGIATGSELTVFQGLVYQAMVTEPENEARRIATRLLAGETETSFSGGEESTHENDVIMKDTPLLRSTYSTPCKQILMVPEGAAHSTTLPPITRKFLKVKKGESSQSVCSSSTVNAEAPALSQSHLEPKSTKVNNTALQILPTPSLPKQTSVPFPSSSKKSSSPNGTEQPAATHSKFTTEIATMTNHSRTEPKSSHDHISVATDTNRPPCTSFSPKKAPTPKTCPSTIPTYSERSDTHQSPKSLISPVSPSFPLPISDDTNNNTHTIGAKRPRSSSPTNVESHTPTPSGANNTTSFFMPMPMPQTPPPSMPGHRAHKNQIPPKTPSTPRATTPKPMSMQAYNNSPGVLFTPLSQRIATKRPTSAEGNNCLNEADEEKKDEIRTPSRSSGSGGPLPAYSDLAASSPLSHVQERPSFPALKEETPTPPPTKRKLFHSSLTSSQSTRFPTRPPSHISAAKPSTPSTPSTPKERNRNNRSHQSPISFSPRTQRVLDEIHSKRERERKANKRRRLESDVKSDGGEVEGEGKGKQWMEREMRESGIWRETGAEREIIDLVGDD